MNIDHYGRISFSESELFDALYKGSTETFNNIFVNEEKISTQFNQSKQLNFDNFDDLNVLPIIDINIEEFDKQNQSNWFMPENYFENITEYLYSCCKNDLETQRVSEELELFAKYNMVDLLRYLKYLVDTMRKNNIVWGVGRGSSVSSYILYLLGVHKIDSIRYNLDIHEFLK